MGLADAVTKAYMKENTVFADAFNYLIYGGKAVVDPAQLQELDTTEIALPFGAQDKNGKQPDDAVQKYRDVLKSAVFKQISIIAIIIHDDRELRIFRISSFISTIFNSCTNIDDDFRVSHFGEEIGRASCRERV